MKTLGLIGFPLGHSFSMRYFTAKFAAEGLHDFEYKNFPIESADSLPQIIEENPSLIALNVTIPHKLNVIKYLDKIDSLAEKIGAVNCIKINRNASSYTLEGYNTDYMGFRDSLLNMIGSNRPKALILGTGGASRAVAAALDTLGIEWKYVSRQESQNCLSYDILSDEILTSHKLIINCTPLGMHPNYNAKPAINYNLIGSNHYLFDLIFNPHETQFLKEGRLRGAFVKNGYEMLVGQAQSWWSLLING